jgi:hypothetical protein
LNFIGPFRSQRGRQRTDEAHELREAALGRLLPKFSGRSNVEGSEEALRTGSIVAGSQA